MISCLVLASTAIAQDETPLIDVYTMGQGDDVFAHFGHSAVCVTDSTSPRGRCYNYGTADFSTPVPLTYDFIRGRALFWVSVIDRDRMLPFYLREDRTVWRQRLPLTHQQAMDLASALAASTQESEKYYRYHHFEDNCTTRIRDLIDRTLGGVLSSGTKDKAAGPSFREYARRGFAGYPPLLVAANLVLGRSRDRPTSQWEAMFLPEVFRDSLEEKLGAKPEVLYQRRAPSVPQPLWTGEALLAALGLVLGLSVAIGAWLARSRLRDSPRRFLLRRISLAPAAILLGVLGLALAFLATFSAFEELRWNEALLVLWPTDLALPFLSALWLRRYLSLRVAVLALVLVLWVPGVLVQPLLPALVLAGVPLGVALYFAITSGPARGA